MTTRVTTRFVSVGDTFELEYAGQFIRIWHDACRKHDLLPDDEESTVEKWKAAHRCGARTSDWGRGGAW